MRIEELWQEGGTWVLKYWNLKEAKLPDRHKVILGKRNNMYIHVYFIIAGRAGGFT